MNVLQRKLLRDLWARKGVLVTLLVIMAVGVAAFVGMASVYRDLEGARRAYYADERLAHLFVELKRMPAQAVAQAERLPNVARLRGRVQQPVLVDLPGEARPLQGVAISMPDTRHPVLNDLHLRSGGWFSTPDAREVILDHAFATARGLRPGDRLKVQLLDRQHELLVVGTAMSPEFVYLIPPDGGFAPDPARYGVLFAPERFLQEGSDLRGAWNQLIGQLHDTSPAAVERTLELLTAHLDPWGVSLATSARDTPSVRYVEDELMGLEVQSRLLPTLFLGVSALILNVLLGRMVAQQRTVIGTLRALGYGRAALTRHYLAYGLVLGAAGGVLGVLLGLWLQEGMLTLYHRFFAIPGLAAHPHPAIAAAGFAISLLAALAGTLKGVRAAARLAPADAMRPPPPERGGRILLERIAPLWRRLGFRPRLVLRSLFRNPFRSLVGLLATTLSTALVFSSLAMDDALDHLMRHQFEALAHQDYSLTLRDPHALDAARNEVAGLPGAVRVEGQLAVSCELAHGLHHKRVAVIGLTPDARLYTPLDAAGRRLPIPAAGLLLDAKLAEVLGVAVGDSLRLRPLIGERREVEAPVARIVEGYLGLSAYADLRYLSRLVGEAQAANTLLVRAQPGAALPTPELKARPAVIGVGERLRAFHVLESTFGDTMGIMIGALVLFSGAIAFGSVLNASLVALSERRQEVGTLRVLGYRTLQVAALFMGESALLNGAGILLGLLAGVGLSHLLALAYSTELYRFPAVILPGTLLLSALVVAAFTAAAQGILYLMVRRLDWLAALNVKE